MAEHQSTQVRDIRPLGAITRVTLKVKDHASLSGLSRGATLYFKPKVWPAQSSR